MSKTKGNVLDPIEVTEKYGTDAVRFTLAAMASPGTDIAFNEARTEGYRAFANKIWNAARFIFMNVERAEAAGVWWLEEFQKKSAGGPGALQVDAKTLEDRWILSRFHRVTQQVNDALASYRFHDAANEVYQFFWGEFCDWYIEIVKLRLTAGANSTEDEKQASRAAYYNLLMVFEGSLRLLSPFMPFLTEELWHAIYDGKPPRKSIALAAFPSSCVGQIDEAAEHDMKILQDLVVNVRNLRAELKAEPKLRLPIKVHANSGIRSIFEQNRITIEKLAGVQSIEYLDHTLESLAETVAKVQFSYGTRDFDVALVYERKIDIAAERERLNKELKKMEAERANAESQLNNGRFLGKAPAHVVEGLRKRAAELDMLIPKTRQALDQLNNPPS